MRVFLLSRFGLHIVFCCQRSLRSLLKTFLLSIFRSTSETSPKSFTFYLLSDKRWRWGDSNPWPMPCKGTALPAELHPLSPNEEFWMKNEEFWFPNEASFPSFFILTSSFFLFLHFSEWAFQDSNLRPRPYQRRALTSWAKSPLDNSEPAEISLYPYFFRRPECTSVFIQDFFLVCFRLAPKCSTLA